MTDNQFPYLHCYCTHKQYTVAYSSRVNIPVSCFWVVVVRGGGRTSVVGGALVSGGSVTAVSVVDCSAWLPPGASSSLVVMEMVVVGRLGVVGGRELSPSLPTAHGKWDTGVNVNTMPLPNSDC